VKGGLIHDGNRRTKPFMTLCERFAKAGRKKMREGEDCFPAGIKRENSGAVKNTFILKEAQKGSNLWGEKTERFSQQEKESPG